MNTILSSPRRRRSSPDSCLRRNDKTEHISKLLRAGKLVALPTETVYGLAADATHPDAIHRIFEIKGRPTDQPLSILIPKDAPLTRWAIDIPDIAYTLAQKFWPGPLTILLKKAPHIPNSITGGKDTIGLRVPDHPITLKILEDFPQGLVAPSANLYGKPPPTTAKAVQDILGNSIAAIVDGGPSKIGTPSTLIDLTQTPPKILRSGPILSAIQKACGLPPLPSKP